MTGIISLSGSAQEGRKEGVRIMFAINMENFHIQSRARITNRSSDMLGESNGRL
jgi:hypothetical protein